MESFNWFSKTTIKVKVDGILINVLSDTGSTENLIDTGITVENLSCSSKPGERSIINLT